MAKKKVTTSNRALAARKMILKAGKKATAGNMAIARERLKTAEALHGKSAKERATAAKSNSSKRKFK